MGIEDITGISVKEALHKEKLPQPEKSFLNTFNVQEIKTLPYSRNEIQTPFCSVSEAARFAISVVKETDYFAGEAIENERARKINYNGKTIELWPRPIA